MSAHALLRAATRAAHDGVDSLYSRWDLADRDQYRAFLEAQAAAFLPVEDALDRAGIAGVVADWTAIRRGPLLVADLADLGAVPPDPDPDLAFDSIEEALGAAYVLEGSRLGGAMLARSVGAGFPARFLAPGPKGHWRAFLTMLEHMLVSNAHRDSAVRGADRVFSLFSRAAAPRSGNI